jgi:hypothetical protein
MRKFDAKGEFQYARDRRLLQVSTDGQTLPESRGGWVRRGRYPEGCIQARRSDRVRTLSAAHDLHRSGAPRHTPVSSLYTLANDEPTVSSLYCLAS